MKFIGKWMELETIILSEVTWRPMKDLRKKDKCLSFSHMWLLGLTFALSRAVKKLVRGRKMGRLQGEGCAMEGERGIMERKV